MRGDLEGGEVGPDFILQFLPDGGIFEGVVEEGAQSDSSGVGTGDYYFHC